MLFYVFFFNYQMCKLLNAVAFYLAFVVCYQIKITVGNMPLFKVFHNARCAAFIVIIWVILAVCTFACAVNIHLNTPNNLKHYHLSAFAMYWLITSQEWSKSACSSGVSEISIISSMPSLPITQGTPAETPV